MSYTIEHIKAAYRAAKQGISESTFVEYLKTHSLLFEEVVEVKKGKKTKVGKKGKRAPRGSVGASIIKFLQKKGSGGAHVKEIAEAIGSKPQNVTSYFYSPNVKKKKIIKALGQGRFALTGKAE